MNFNSNLLIFYSNLWIWIFDFHFEILYSFFWIFTPISGIESNPKSIPTEIETERETCYHINTKNNTNSTGATDKRQLCNEPSSNCRVHPEYYQYCNCVVRPDCELWIKSMPVSSNDVHFIRVSTVTTDIIQNSNRPDRFANITSIIIIRIVFPDIFFWSYFRIEVLI